MTHTKKRRASISSRVFDVIVYTLLVLVALVTIIPFLQVVTISMSPPEVVASYGLHLFPTKIDMEGYRSIFKYKLLWSSYYNTIVRTALGTGLSMVLYIVGAYPLSKRYLPNRRFWMFFVIFTMYFSGGMIPSYLLINNWLKLSNTLWALAMSAYNLIIVRNFFESIPDSLEESARIDGARETTVLFRIVVPLSKPVLATVALWCMVSHWNAWYDCMLYIRDDARYVLQYTLQRILLDGQVQDLDNIGAKVNTETMKMASIVVSILPIMVVYPFVQKYFTKGVMIGAVKG